MGKRTKKFELISVALFSTLFSVLFSETIFSAGRFVFGQESEDGIVSFSIPVQNAAAIYSGPGTDYYPTGTLNAGNEVEVFFRQENGWLAIKPPRGCFSWINARFVRVDFGKIGVITTENNDKEVPVRIGADSVLNSSIIQIGLKNGDKVQILSETTLPDGKKWFKIAPPPGEFRWIQENSLVPDEIIARLPNRLLTTREYWAMIRPDETASSIASNVGDAPQKNAADFNATQSRNDLRSQENGFDASNRSERSKNQNLENVPYPDEILNQNDFQNLKESSKSFAANDATPNDSGRPEGVRPTNSPVGQAESPERNQETEPFQTIAERLQNQPTRPRNPANAPNPLAPSGNYKLPIWDTEFADNNFNLEVARLNRDLFLSVCQSSSADVFDLLEDRAATLFDVASNDEQRFSVKKVWNSIEKYRPESGKFAKSGLETPVYLASGTLPSEATTVDRAANAVSNDKIPVPQTDMSSLVSFDRRSLNNPSVPISVDRRDATASETARPRKMQFAFSNANNPFKNRSKASVDRSNNANSPSVDATKQTTNARPSGTNVSGRRIPSLLPKSDGPQLVPPHDYKANYLTPSNGAPSAQNNRSTNQPVRSQPVGQPTTQIQSPNRSPESPQPQNRVPETPWDSKTPNIPTTFLARQSNASRPATETNENAAELDWKSPNQIRQVIAVLTEENDDSPRRTNDDRSIQNSVFSRDDDETSKTNVATWEVPSRLLEKESAKQNPNSGWNAESNSNRLRQNPETPESTPKSNPTFPSEETTKNDFDAMGVLGFFPKRPDGFPAYALAEQIDGRTQIVCFVESESGKNLDQFIGRTIGVNGKKAILKFGSESYRVVTAKSIFAMKQE